MSYSHLSVEERIQKASEYALLLVQEEKPGTDLTSELARVFDLTHEQATEACVRMRRNFESVYQQSLSGKIRLAWGSAAVSALMMVFFYFMAAELAWGYFFFVLVSAGGLIGALGMIAKWQGDKRRQLKDQFPLAGTATADNRRISTIGELVIFFLLVTVIAAFIYTNGSGRTDINEVTVVKNLVLSGYVESKSTGGKNPDHYYLFHVEGMNSPLKWLDDYYSYGHRGLAPGDFSAGDTISIMLKKEKAAGLLENSSTGPVTIYNVQHKGSWLLDLEERNRLKKSEDRRLLFIFGGLLLGVSILFIAGMRYFRQLKA